MSRPLGASELAEWYERCAPAVFRRARALLGDEAGAWDVVQDVFCHLAEGPTSFRREAQPMTYLYRMATNLSLNRLRHQRVQARATAEEPSVEPFSTPELAETRQLLTLLAETLDERALRVAAYHFMDGMTQEEVAGAVGLSRRTVGKILEAVRQSDRTHGGIPE